MLISLTVRLMVVDNLFSLSRKKNVEKNYIKQKKIHKKEFILFKSRKMPPMSKA